ncbi:MAG: hypothetical protein P1V81_14860 [Planctomycetota bacterium]|nr:hypothetical protein [Planctomycetota bacterium]
MNRFLCLLAAGVLPAIATASDLDLSIESGGQNSLTVSPGQLVAYDVVGELTDSLNEGLALFSIDLKMPGVTLTPLAAPTSAAMQNFASPLGLNNPAGFGGTQSRAALKQVGGMQNTLKNSFAPKPSGTVMTGLAQPGAPETLASGVVVVPTQSGTYTLSALNVLANVIRQGETGSPTWMVDAAGVGANTPLTVTVESLSQSTNTISLAAGGTVNFSLDGGLGSAGLPYLMLGSTTGTIPGFWVDGLKVNLTYDAFTSFMITNPNKAPYSNTFGAFDAFGLASAAINVPAGFLPGLAGATIHHSYVVFGAGGTIVQTSNATSIDLLP